MREEQHRRRGAPRFGHRAHQRLLGRPPAVRQERGQTHGVHREPLQLVQERRRQRRLPRAGVARQQQAGLPRQRAVHELERRRVGGRRETEPVRAPEDVQGSRRASSGDVGVVRVERERRRAEESAAAADASGGGGGGFRRLVRHRRGRECAAHAVQRARQRFAHERAAQRAERARVRLRGAVRRRRDGLHGGAEVHARRCDLRGVDHQLVVALVDLWVPPAQRVHRRLRAQRLQVGAAVPHALLGEVL